MMQDFHDPAMEGGEEIERMSDRNEQQILAYSTIAKSRSKCSDNAPAHWECFEPRAPRALTSHMGPHGAGTVRPQRKIKGAPW